MNPTSRLISLEQNTTVYRLQQRAACNTGNLYLFNDIARFLRLLDYASKQYVQIQKRHLEHAKHMKGEITKLMW